ncbi:ComF family protein [Caulobacter segnis]|uniref:ComF family protein n=1 Tax=Caulobacter segnis TaxID=88688 RepID=UPI00240ECCD1|nr:ComF family protein [Caulobacter segnis]MDG2520841.1 ComF family protein [Caulobacter segnis]
MGAQHGDLQGGWKPAPSLISAGRGFLDLLLPPQALDGGSVGSPGLGAEAWSRITFIADPACDGCGAPFDFDPGPGVACPTCAARPKAFARARAACLYDEHSRNLILQLKHADRTDLAPLMARWLSRAAADLLAEADAIAPVPLHSSRLFARRYDQAAEVARPLARLANLPYLPDALIRRRATATQGGKSGSGRRRNVAGAFAVPPGRRRQVEGRRILLVDDVMTTGATLDACARALLGAGAASVSAAVIARVKEAPDVSM